MYRNSLSENEREMTIHPIDRLTLTVPLARPAHQLAEQFCQHQSNLQKAEQVYLNTLAVYAVNHHLQCLGFETDWTQSASWDSIMQTFLDVADLQVKNYGKLECRPVVPDAEVVYIPEEVWEERIGYVAVQLDESLREATLLGFAETVSTQELPLSQLRSLEDLPEYLTQHEQLQLAKEQVNLSQWLQNIFETGWETVEALLAPPQAELAFGFRNFSSVPARNPDPANRVKRGKRLDLGGRGDGQVVVLVGVTPSASSKMDISIEVYPTDDHTYLPQNLQLMVLDEMGEAVVQAQARSTENIRVKFSGAPGERFSVKIALGNVSITEAFAL